MNMLRITMVIIGALASALYFQYSFAAPWIAKVTGMERLLEKTEGTAREVFFYVSVGLSVSLYIAIVSVVVFGMGLLLIKAAGITDVIEREILTKFLGIGFLIGIVLGLLIMRWLLSK